MLPGDHLGKLSSSGDRGDSDGVSSPLPNVSSEDGESRGEMAAGEVALRASAGRLGEAVTPSESPRSPLDDNFPRWSPGNMSDKRDNMSHASYSSFIEQ
jgi:hypothetical protein